MTQPFYSLQRKKDASLSKSLPTPSKEQIFDTFDKLGATVSSVGNRLTSSITGSSSRPSGSASAMEEAYDVIETATPSGGVESDSMSFSTSYCGEWEKLFQSSHFMSTLKDYGLCGKLRSSRFRSVCWKVYLGVLPPNTSKWKEKTKEWRDKYTALKNKLIINPREEMDRISDLHVNNPLSQDEESPWNQYFQDNDLRLTIKQDVIRTFPDVQFFQDQSLHDKMVNVLFCYAKHNTKIMYKQGMHELLAPLIFVLHCDQQAFLHACEIESVRDIVKDILDPEYIEHDAFALFWQIMETVELWYVSQEVSPTIRQKNVFRAQPFARPQDMSPSNVIIAKLTRIQDYLLKKFDPDLQLRLDQMEIPPQIYGIRWLRLLFGREFPMQDLLVLWDALFADSCSFDLVDYIFVAMLLYLRDALIESDYPTCLSFLMKYPPVGDIHYFIKMAMYLREPNSIPKPMTYTYQKPANYTAGGYGNGGGGNGFPSETYGGKKTEVDRHHKDCSHSKTLPPHRKGSTASLSHIEDSMRPLPVRGANSIQNLTMTESMKSDSVASGGVGTPSSEKSSPVRRKGKHNKHKQNEPDPNQHDAAFLLGKLNDMEMMCQKCADKMDVHIDTLQCEMLKQRLDGEDELLLALAGLKQVRDVLKGILKPCNIFNSEEIRIHDNHYVHPVSLSPRLPIRAQHSTDTSQSQDSSQQQMYSSSTSEFSSEAELTSPESDQTNTTNGGAAMGTYSAPPSRATSNASTRSRPTVKTNKVVSPSTDDYEHLSPSIPNTEQRDIELRPFERVSPIPHQHGYLFRNNNYQDNQNRKIAPARASGRTLASDR